MKSELEVRVSRTPVVAAVISGLAFLEFMCVGGLRGQSCDDVWGCEISSLLLAGKVMTNIHACNPEARTQVEEEFAQVNP